ncbi:aminotransferase class I/II-fold pyridoxal phosphate-dependent enzyme [Nonomuraea roseoviolacea]|uniref:DNA-binding transcriptional MocR family regulator n=1 Tax=Nonomuraea roseoviolacea subsp. carminata TaxID=160689 RepID=A0ABT1JZE8_9ACTN|nr:aminotransferase class I/II-fold pyridoxal phosphate-dependent enzyme [Nonomuraea roseoviolacea]MCP2346626.1 DNA-binding transcriptional MocR family regulator [Nonomuraea roseoviolacea subsp. carminata]
MSETSELIDLLGEWSSAEGPLYRRLTEAFVRAVRSGDLRTGDRLPSERRLADALSVSRATVVAVYDALRGSGLVETRRGSSTRVSGAAADQRTPADGRVRGGQATAVIRVAELAAEHGVPLLEDSARAAALAPGQAPPPIAAHHAGGTVLTVGSLAKAVWGGLRIGWIRAPRDAVTRLARLKALSDLGSPLLDQALAARLLPELPALAPERDRIRRERLATVTRLLAERLPDWRWREPQGGSVLWIRLPPGTDARIYAQVALRHGAEVVPGATMDPTGAHDDYIRLPCSFAPDISAELVSRLATAWAALPRSGGR